MRVMQQALPVPRARRRVRHMLRQAARPRLPNGADLFRELLDLITGHGHLDAAALNGCLCHRHNIGFGKEAQKTGGLYFNILHHAV